MAEIEEEAYEPEEAPELNKTLETVLVAALTEAKRKLLEEGEVVPFTALGMDDKLLIETHPCGDVEDCFEEAEKKIAESNGALAYAFCYDGYVETEEGQRDILIAEGGMPGEEDGHAIGFLYELPEEEGGEIIIDDEPVYVGPAPNFMA